MANDPKNPIIGELAVDASELAEYLVDLPPGGRLGLRSARSGFIGVLAEILANQPTFGARAGVTSFDFDELVKNRDVIARIDAILPAADKLVEILTETRAKLDDEMQRLVTAIANAVEGRASASGNEELLARYAKTRAYRSEVGLKAARTRRQRNQGEDELEDEAPDAPDAPDAPVPDAPVPDAPVAVFGDDDGFGDDV